MSDYKEAMNDKEYTIVDFYATWCPPCVTATPIFAKMSNDFPQVTFLKVDVDMNKEIAQAEGIEAMPTFKLF